MANMSNNHFFEVDFKLKGQSMGISATNPGILPNPHSFSILDSPCEAGSNDR